MPASGYRNNNDGSLNNVGNNGNYWSASPDFYGACYMYFNISGGVHPSYLNYRADGQAVRCVRE